MVWAVPNQTVSANMSRFKLPEHIASPTREESKLEEEMGLVGA